MIRFAEGFSRSLVTAVLLFVSTRALHAQESIDPPTITHGPTGILSVPVTENQVASRILDAPGMTFGLDGAQPSVNLKAVRIGVFGRPICEIKGGKRVCVSQVKLSVNLTSQIVDGVNDFAKATREYLLSASGSPVTIAPNLNFIGFNTRVDTVPQFWWAGNPVVDARLIPVAGTADEGLSWNGSVSAGYNLEVHPSVQINTTLIDAYITVRPSVTYMIGREIVPAANGEERSARTVFSVGYSLGYQFGGVGGKSLRIAGTWSSDNVGGSKHEMKVGLQQLVRAFSPPSRGS